MEQTKKCIKCGRELPLDQFYFRKDTGKYRSYCRTCRNTGDATWRKNNPDKCSEASRRWSESHPGELAKRSAKWRKDNPEKSREIGARCRKNHPEYNANKIKHTKARRAIDLGFKVKSNIRNAMWAALRNNIKAGHTIELLGCPIEDLRSYLENLFQPGMTWDNYGKYGWHIDHIIPLSYFDFNDPEQQKRAWHYTNLRPMWAIDNIKKGNKIFEVQLVLL
jgi:hypothetical protein